MSQGLRNDVCFGCSINRFHPKVNFLSLPEESPSVKHELPALPFSQDALAPIMSAETLEYEHAYSIDCRNQRPKLLESF
jgi:hypothetical protein